MSISLTVSVNGITVRRFPALTFKPGMTAQQALEAAYAAGNRYSFVLQYFGNLGYEVIALDGIAAQQGPDAAFYWELFRNDAPAQQGIESAVLNDGDQLGLSYTVYDPVRHAGTRLQAVHEGAWGPSKRPEPPARGRVFAEENSRMPVLDR